MHSIDSIRAAVYNTVKDYPIKRVDLFGSYASGTANDDSDIDILVEFSETPISLFKISGFQQALSDLLNMEVDVVEAPLQPDSMLIIDRTVCLYGS
ncbi:MAG: nucleotidyltransferase domain-containing protein [Clostridia bacterium]|nr:nucleotidyltransferase domain-containing protein [Clostridia bacterium]